MRADIASRALLLLSSQTGQAAGAAAGAGGHGGHAPAGGGRAGEGAAGQRDGAGHGAQQGRQGGVAAGGPRGGAGAVPPSPMVIRANLFPGLTVAPSSTRSSSMTPDTGDGTGTDVLSVSISQITSSTAMLSPLAFSHLRSPSVIDSAKAGHSITCSSSKRKLVCKPRTVISIGPIPVH